jgi:hypothetical protein
MDAVRDVEPLIFFVFTAMQMHMERRGAPVVRHDGVR